MTYKKDREIKIGNTLIGDYHEPKFISEIGVNHLGNFDRMKNMIRLS